MNGQVSVKYKYKEDDFPLQNIKSFCETQVTQTLGHWSRSMGHSQSGSERENSYICLKSQNVGSRYTPI